MQRIKKSFESKAKAKPPGLNDADLEEILDTAGHIPDRDQEFSVIDTTESGERWIGGTQEDLMTGVEDEDEGDTGIVSDPAYDRDGAERILRSTLGDASVEEHMTPAAIAGEGAGDDPRGIEHLSCTILRQRASALGIPGRSKMTKSQLAVAVHSAIHT